MLTNSTISHLLINRNNLQYLDVAGLLAKYNLFNTTIKHKINIYKKYNISSNYYTLNFIHILTAYNMLFKKRYNKIYNQITYNNTSLPPIIKHEKDIVNGIPLDSVNFQYPDMFNLEILTDDTINNMCKYKSRLEKVMKLFSSKKYKETSMSKLQCKVLWTDIIFIYGTTKIIKGGKKKQIHNKQFNQYYKKIKASKIKTTKNKKSKKKTLKIIY